MEVEGRSIKVDNAQILPGPFRNFTGRPTQVNKAGGKKSFCIKLTQEQAAWFANYGFNVKDKPNTTDPQAEHLYLLSINVSWKKKAPKIVMITDGVGTLLTQTTVQNLDTAEIQYADLSINPYPYDANGTTKYSAYLNDLYVTIAENPYAKKYAGIKINNPECDNYGDPDDIPFN